MPSLLGLQPQSLLQSVLDNVGVALAVIDHEGRFVFTNQAALNMFGATESIGGVLCEEWRRDYVFCDNQGRVIPWQQASLLRALAGDEVEPQEVGVTLPDGRTKWLHSAGSRFSVMGLTGVFVIITDETEQVELRRAVEQAHRAEAVGLLAGGLAHDLNNMLSVLSGNLILALADQGIPETTRERLQQMQVALGKGAALATRLVRNSRTQKIQTRSVQINDIVNSALQLAGPLLKTRVKVKTELGGSLPAVEADISRMEQVLVNLILNALDAMPDGGELTVHTEIVPGDSVSAWKNENAAQFVLTTIADTGTGIPENLQESIFDPFFTTKPDGKGAGLGLSSASEIVRQHKGHIKVQSAPGAGTKFSVYLPVMECSSSLSEKVA
jgi:two-component system, cell cycle sensor histidine kinase and response regulator CckA